MSGARGKGLSRFWLDDEEMAKKDDDLNTPGHSHKRPHALSLSHSAPGGSWQSAAPRPPRRGLILRLLIYMCLMLLAMMVLLHVFGPAQPGTYLEDNGPRRSEPLSTDPLPPSAGGQDGMPQKPPPPQQPPRPPVSSKKVSKNGFNDLSKAKDLSGTGRYHNAPLRFPFLADTLQSITFTDGDLPVNKNILFAAASSRSMATLLPLACRMAQEKSNWVHFAFIHNTEIPMKELLKLNGIDKTCPIIAHDARPDQVGISTDLRMARASSRAMYHMGAYMHPQAVLVDSSAGEHSWFLAGVRDQLQSQKTALIELPEGSIARLEWLTKLDSGSLAEWNRVTFDIIVQAPSSGTESMRRLLASLGRADLSSVATPHLTVELPAIVDKPLEDFLNGFSWPSGPRTTSKPSLLTLRRRVTRSKLDPEESTARFLETFWPADPTMNHVLVLSPNVEVSPHFFHYVKFAILQYRHGLLAMESGWEHRLFGLGFARPQTLLDGKEAFVSPPGLDAAPSTSVPFMWQAPNSDAMLIFGRKWQEMHNFAALHLERQAAGGSTPSFLAKKQVGENQPAWLEYLLQISRLRGYFTLYPSPETSDAILGAHKDLYHIPEEYQRNTVDPSGGDTKGLSYKVTQYAETFDPGSAVDLLTLLPNKGRLDPLSQLPLLAWDGKKSSVDGLEVVARDYAREFRRDVGGCSPDELERMPNWFAEDLFCTTKGDEAAAAPAVAAAPVAAPVAAPAAAAAA
ncbi:glycosyltransferase 2 [Sarocladium implicatum]|nr:glycosyltransferase 2 [Sarocladium implicatum]